MKTTTDMPLAHLADLARRASLALAALLLAGCAQVREPQALPAIREELKQAAQPPAAKPQPPAASSAPALALKPTQGIEPPPAKPEPRFNLALNSAPAQQVFLGIASGSRYSMLLHPEVAGFITVNLKDVTVPEAMAALRDLYGYEYRIDDNRVIVQPLAPQTRFYAIPYPASLRQGKSELRVISGSIADAGTAGGASANGGSASGGAVQLDSSRVVTSSQTDFWNELKASIALLIGCADGGGSAGAACPAGRSVMVSPHTGMLAVRALPAEQRQVNDYLKAARLAVERQVMIEAKILEVTLNEDAQTGINWAWFYHNNSLSKGANSAALTIPKTDLNALGGAALTDVNSFLGGGLPGSAGATAANLTDAGVFGLALQATNFTALLNFLETQGSVQVLSSPRIAAINNQKAVLKVGTDEFFVTGITSNTSTTGATTTSSPTLTVQPFFSGIALDVTPRIDEGDNIILHVHPSVSVVTTNNKTIELGDLGQYILPLAASSISETDSVVRLRDGQIAAIGGLMKRASRDADSEVPGLGGLPLLGHLFRNTNASRLKQELVILLKPTLIREPGDWGEGAREVEARLASGRP
jgi:MSHA biogenesis protein MshL